MDYKLIFKKNYKYVLIAVVITIFGAMYTFFYGINNFDGFKQVLFKNAFTSYTYTFMNNNIFLGLLTPIISIIASYNLIFNTHTRTKNDVVPNLAQCCMFSGGSFVIAQLLVLILVLFFR